MDKVKVVNEMTLRHRHDASAFSVQKGFFLSKICHENLEKERLLILMLKEMAMIKCKPLNIKDGNKGKIIELPVQITLD